MGILIGDYKMEFKVVSGGKWKDGFLRKRNSRLLLNMSVKTPATNSMIRMELNSYKWLYDGESKALCCHVKMTQLTGYKHYMDTNTRVCSILVCDQCGNIKIGKFDLRCIAPNSSNTKMICNNAIKEPTPEQMVVIKEYLKTLEDNGIIDKPIKVEEV
jgi:hypothetical protein